MADAAKKGDLPEEYYPGLFDERTTIWKIFCEKGWYKGVDLSLPHGYALPTDVSKAVIKDISDFLAVRPAT